MKPTVLRSTRAACVACAACAVLVLLPACDKKAELSPQPATSASASASVPPATSAAPSAAPSSSTEGQDNLPPGALGIGARLTQESSHRPTGIVRADEVFDAMKGVGATFGSQKQHVGSVYKAKYCAEVVNATDDYFIDVCEYEDAKSGKEGFKLLQAFSLAPGREVHQSGATVLTIRVGKATPENKALAKKMVDAFAKLKPTAKPAPAPSVSGK